MSQLAAPRRLGSKQKHTLFVMEVRSCQLEFVGNSSLGENSGLANSPIPLHLFNTSAAIPREKIKESTKSSLAPDFRRQMTHFSLGSMGARTLSQLSFRIGCGVAHRSAYFSGDFRNMVRISADGKRYRLLRCKTANSGLPGMR